MNIAINLLLCVRLNAIYLPCEDIFISIWSSDQKHAFAMIGSDLNSSVPITKRSHILLQTGTIDLSIALKRLPDTSKPAVIGIIFEQMQLLSIVSPDIGIIHCTHHIAFGSRMSFDISKDSNSLIRYRVLTITSGELTLIALATITIIISLILLIFNKNRSKKLALSVLPITLFLWFILKLWQAG